MRKRDLVHLHALLIRTRRFVDRREELPEGTFDRYEELDVTPTAIYEAKGEHQSAVRALAGALAEAIEETGEAPGTDGDDGDPAASPDDPLGATTD